MAVVTRNVLVASLLLLSLLVLPLVEGDQVMAVRLSTPSSGTQSPITKTTTIDCGSACVARCQLSSRPRLCNRACGTCCFRCQCVPPGTSGNYDACPCYANMTTHGNRRKCP
ncbi:gibberellin-regulated protein 1-like [Telopea speciosissima]|uniref:gibberellin-regulated protein 1-like n=1 Tax=Telopea speciosissima TaxID=54955 RepID=UPI001CC5881F|nr:gibberellin-regulated protein 1-like [Telopea speciosissima]XP_043712251.1 gibberellin-regulated protein 1-like [Telopea speciosissima]